MQKFKSVVPPNGDQRVDKYLAEILAVSRSQIQKMIANGRVFINGRMAIAHDRLRGGEEVEVAAAAEKKIKQAIKVKYGVITPQPDYFIIYNSLCFYLFCYSR